MKNFCENLVAKSGFFVLSNMKGGFGGGRTFPATQAVTTIAKRKEVIPVREQAAIAADIVSSLRRLADALEEFVQIPKGKKQEEQPSAATPTLEEVRTALMARSVAGHGAEVKQLIGKFGVSKLSEIAPEHYEAVLKEAESIGK